jgi:hypothetical protein
MLLSLFGKNRVKNDEVDEVNTGRFCVSDTDGLKKDNFLVSARDFLIVRKKYNYDELGAAGVDEVNFGLDFEKNEKNPFFSSMVNQKRAL